MNTIEISNIGKRYKLGATATGYSTLRETLSGLLRRNRARSTSRPEFHALKGISFNVKAGETVGIIGGNGAGKSTLLKILSRITEPSEGEIRLTGRVGSLLEVGTGFHPELTGRENVFLSGSLLGMSRREIARKFDSIVDFAGVPEFIDTPVKRYSSGMQVRLGFAVAAHFEPEILLVDEVLAVGDAEFQRKCMARMSEVGQAGRTILFVSHNMSAIAQLCSRAVLLHKGMVAHDGSVQDAIKGYLDMGASDGSIATFPTDPAKGAQITRIALHGPDGKPTATHDWNQPVDVVVDVQAHAPASLNCTIQLLTAEGVRVSQSIGANWFHGTAAMAEREVARYTARFPGGALNPAAFQFVVMLTEGDVGLFDVRHSPMFWIEPMSPANTFLGMRKRDLSILRLPVEWRLDRLGGAQAIDSPIA